MNKLDLKSRINIWLPGDPATATQQERKIAWAQRRTYLSAAARQAREKLIAGLRPYAPAEPYDCAVSVQVDFIFLHPKTGNRYQTYKKTKPDADNLAKGLLDAMQACGFFTNDSRVSELIVRKIYAADNSQPGIYITIEPLED